MQDDMEYVGLTLDTLGVVMIAFAALRVHHRVLNEHRIDKKVYRDMRVEQIIGVFGIVI